MAAAAELIAAMLSAKYTEFTCRAPLLHVAIFFVMWAQSENIKVIAVQIRSQVALEFIEDLKEVSEENSVLLRESLVASLSLSFETLPVADKDSSTSA